MSGTSRGHRTYQDRAHSSAHHDGLLLGWRRGVNPDTVVCQRLRLSRALTSAVALCAQFWSHPVSLVFETEPLFLRTLEDWERHASLSGGYAPRLNMFTTLTYRARPLSSFFFKKKLPKPFKTWRQPSKTEIPQTKTLQTLKTCPFASGKTWKIEKPVKLSKPLLEDFLNFKTSANIDKPKKLFQTIFRQHVFAFFICSETLFETFNLFSKFFFEFCFSKSFENSHSFFAFFGRKMCVVFFHLSNYFSFLENFEIIEDCENIRNFQNFQTFFQIMKTKNSKTLKIWKTLNV